MEAPLLEFSGIEKSFPGVRALSDVSFTLHRGEIKALVGENGAGKSTLLAILGGSLHLDSGAVIIDGARREEFTPGRALADGVVIAHQEPAVVPQLTVEENLLLGRTRKERYHAHKEVKGAMKDLELMGFDLSPSTRLSELSPAQRQALTIARAFSFGAKIVALDEPTTSLLENNITPVLNRVKELAHEKGVGIIYVSHKINEVMEVSDSIAVLRDGVIQFDRRTKDTTVDEVVKNMVGRDLLRFHRNHPLKENAPVRLQVSAITHPSGVGPISLSVKAGEVLGIAGLVGAGRTEFLRAIIKADAGCSGKVTVDGKELTLQSPRDSRDAGIAFIPEERKLQGLILQTPAWSNITLTADKEFNTFGPLVKPALQIEASQEIGDKLFLRPKDVRLAARQFSGGNQQKIVIAKWLRKDVKVYLLDEPTKGVDVAGKAEIYALIDILAKEGHAVIVVSSDLPEIIALSDRVVVMRNGKLYSEHSGDEINEHALVASAVGVARDGGSHVN